MWLAPNMGWGWSSQFLGSQASGDSGLAVAQDFGVFSAHSKMLSVGVVFDLSRLQFNQYSRAFTSFFYSFRI
jgi:hypothetical protein